MTKELEERRAFTVSRVEELRDILTESGEFAADNACVYATGSYGRCEASNYSDLDIFIVAKYVSDAQGRKISLLNRLDAICIKANLIKETKKLGFPPFSNEGQYLKSYTTYDFIKALGRPEDYFTNTFTARLLLLLESCALVGKDVYLEIAEEVIAAYWGDFVDHSEDFMPAFLANDILRLWRTFCVNYEAFTERTQEQKAKRKIKNYKLKHSRLMTCYSAILYLLHIYKKHKTVTPLDAKNMFGMSPTHRIELMRNDDSLHEYAGLLDGILNKYESFLIATNIDEEGLKEKFMDKTQSRQLMDASTEFGDLMFEALNQIGAGNRFHRMIVV